MVIKREWRCRWLRWDFARGRWSCSPSYSGDAWRGSKLNDGVPRQRCHVQKLKRNISESKKNIELYVSVVVLSDNVAVLSHISLLRHSPKTYFSQFSLLVGTFLKGLCLHIDIHTRRYLLCITLCENIQFPPILIQWIISNFKLPKYKKEMKSDKGPKKKKWMTPWERPCKKIFVYVCFSKICSLLSVHPRYVFLHVQRKDGKRETKHARQTACTGFWR